MSKMKKKGWALVAVLLAIIVIADAVSLAISATKFAIFAEIVGAVL